MMENDFNCLRIVSFDGLRFSCVQPHGSAVTVLVGSCYLYVFW